MRKPKLTKPQIRQRSKEIVDELIKEHSEDLCAGILQELSGRVQKPQGRKAAANWDLLLEMARRLKSGKAETPTAAARQLAHRIGDVAETTARKRLRTNYSKFRLDLEKEIRAEAEDEEDASRRAEKDEVINRAFAEKVEIWDL